MTSEQEEADKARAIEMLDRIQRGAHEAHKRRDELAAAVDDLAAGFTKLGTKRVEVREEEQR